MSKIKHILSKCGAVCFQFTRFSCDDWENIYTLSYYHHQIGSMNYYPLLRVRSWNNGVHCMYFNIFIKSFWLFFAIVLHSCSSMDRWVNFHFVCWLLLCLILTYHVCHSDFIIICIDIFYKLFYWLCWEEITWRETSIRKLLFINTLRPRQNGRHFTDDNFKHIFLNENARISIKISLKFIPKGSINNIPALVQIMAWRRLGDKPLSELMMVRLPMHIGVTRPQ